MVNRKQLPPVKTSSVDAMDVELPTSALLGHRRSTTQQPLSPLGQVFQTKLLPEDADLVIHVTIGLESPVDMARLLELLENKILKLQRFSSKVVVQGDSGKCYWEGVDVDLDKHVYEVDLTSPATLAQERSEPEADDENDEGGDEPEEDEQDPVLKYSNSIMQRPLDYSRPLWEVHVLRHGRLGVCGGTLLVRIHHSIGDGASMAALFLQLATTASGGALTLPAPRPAYGGEGLVGRLKRLATVIYNTARSLARSTQLMASSGDPVVGIKISKSARHLPAKMAVQQYSLAEIKGVGRQLGGATANDVLLAAMSGAMAKYNKLSAWQKLVNGEASQEGAPSPGPGGAPAAVEPDPDAGPRGMFMVNLRPPFAPGGGIQFGVRVGYWVLRLPGGAKMGAEERLRRVAQVARDCKLSLEAQLSSWLMAALFHIFGRKILLRFLTDMTEKVTTAMSNMAGPTEDTHFLGSRVVRMAQWVTGSPLGLAVHVLSVGGIVFLTFHWHPDFVEGALFMDCFLDAFLELKDAAAAAVGDSSPGAAAGDSGATASLER